MLNSVGLGLGPKLPIAKELPLDANAADPWVSFIILNTLLFYPQLNFSKWFSVLVITLVFIECSLYIRSCIKRFLWITSLSKGIRIQLVSRFKCKETEVHRV